jgi:hypothetical protein
MALTTQQRDRLQRTEFWQNAVANMETFEIPEGYEAANKKDKYERFTGFLKEWLINLIVTPENYSETYDDDHPDKEAFVKTIYGKYNIHKSQKNAFWEELIKVGSGKKELVDDNLNYVTFLKPFKSPTTEELQPIYNMFMPTYHAIKEKFEKRWWIEWIFNHKQYVAERDSLKAMDGLFRELTGYGKLGAEQQLDNFKNELQEMRNDNEELNKVNSLQNQINGNVQNIIVDEVNQNQNELITGQVVEKDLDKENSLDKSNYI